MNELNNPFSPGAGTPPPALVGRHELLEKAAVTLGRVRRRKSAQGMLFVGLRGTGKTVLLSEIRKLAKADGGKFVFIEAHEEKSLADLLAPALRAILLELDDGAKVSQAVKRGLRVLRSFVGAAKMKIGAVEFGLDINPERGAADSGDIETDLAVLLVAVAEAAADRQTAVAIIVDEIQYLHEKEMSALIMGMHQVAQQSLPMALFGAGLPQLVGLAGKSKSYAERLFIYPEIGPLAPMYAREALQGPVKHEGCAFTQEALDEILRMTQGYPYFLQEWGYQAWNLAAASPIDIRVIRQTNKMALAHLDQSFFRVRFDRLTPREKDYLRAMAGLGAGSHRSGDIAELLRVKVQSIAPLRAGLVKKGMIYSPSHGETAFTVPLFEQFMERVMPESKAKAGRK